MGRRDIRLTQCQVCGLVFNAEFDPKVVPYDQSYENRQCFSPEFSRYLRSLAVSLSQRHPLQGGRILEVGCGKGDFLRLLCRTARAKGVGFDTSFERPEGPEQPGVSFHREYLSAESVPGRFSAVICRHVIEHVAEIGTFLNEIRSIALAAGDPVIVFETPSWEWIVKHLCTWDITYEHCNYFSVKTLSYICRLAGFRKIRHRRVFGGQYQLIELAVNRSTPATGHAPGVQEDSDLRTFARQARTKLRRLVRRVERLSRSDGWAIWGAGAKGVALVNQIEGTLPHLVVDSNPAKQGGVLSGTRIPIVNPSDHRLQRLGLVLIANPQYASEIRRMLSEKGFSGSIEVL